MSSTLRLLALGLTVAVVATPARAQGPMPFINGRLDAPLGLLAETGVLFNTLASEAIQGRALVLAAGQHGGRAGVGYRMSAMMGVQLMTNAFYARTWNAPIGVPSRHGYVGADARFGVLFTTVGAGLLVRVNGSGGAPVRLTASIGVGL